VFDGGESMGESLEEGVFELTRTSESSSDDGLTGLELLEETLDPIS